jgi:gas vesicle protein
MKDEKGWQTFVAGFLLGGVIGAGLALLFAPASGVETRAQISKHANKLYEGGKEGAQYIRRLVHDEVESVKDNAQAVKGAVEKGVDEYKKSRV